MPNRLRPNRKKVCTFKRGGVYTSGVVEKRTHRPMQTTEPKKGRVRVHIQTWWSVHIRGWWRKRRIPRCMNQKKKQDEEVCTSKRGGVYTSEGGGRKRPHRPMSTPEPKKKDESGYLSKGDGVCTSRRGGGGGGGHEESGALGCILWSSEAIAFAALFLSHRRLLSLTMDVASDSHHHCHIVAARSAALQPLLHDLHATDAASC